MKTLDEHNTEKQAVYDSLKDQVRTERLAGVACPECKKIGRDTQMEKLLIGRSVSGKQPVICPLCGHSGEML